MRLEPKWQQLKLTTDNDIPQAHPPPETRLQGRLLPAHRCTLFCPKTNMLSNSQPIQTQINTKISFERASGIVIPDSKTLDRQKNIVGRLLKISFYDEDKNCFFGNAVQIEATWKKEYEDRWYFDDDRKSFNNNIIVRYNEDNETKKISVILEFVIVLLKEGVISETSCGWSSVDVKNLYKNSEAKLPIYAGTPRKQEEISQTGKGTKKTGWAKFSNMFSGQIKSELPIKIKPFKELAAPDKVYK